MTLREWLDSKGIAQVEFSRLIRVTPPTVSRYCTDERIPRPKVMARIVRVTGGKVTARDFYPASSPVRPRAAA